MGVIITITGIALVTDDETGKSLRDPARLARIAALKETRETISQYFDAETAELGVKGGDIRLTTDSSGKRFYVQSTFKAARPLTKGELALVVEETTGQWSDGIGEHCFDDAATKYKVTIDLLQRGSRAPKVEQVGDGKPMKLKKPPAPSAELAEKLTKAAAEGNSKAVDELLAAGADPNKRNKRGELPLSSVSKWPWQPGRRPTMSSVRMPIVEALLAAGANPNATNKDGTTSLFCAAVWAEGSRDQNFPIARRLIAAGADPNITPKKNHAPLTWAVIRGGPKFVRLLLDAGADPNVADPKMPTQFPDDVGMTPLFHVDDVETAAMLLAAGADPKRRSANDVYPTAAEYLRMMADANRSKEYLAAAELIERHMRNSR